MAYRKRRAPRKPKRRNRRTYKRKTYNKRKITRRMGMGSWNPQFFKLKRTFQYSGPPTDFSAGYFLMEDPYILTNDIDVNASTSYGFYAFTFDMNDIPNITNYSTRYDQYMIHMVSFRLEYLNSTTAIQAGSSEERVKLLIWNDYDDTTSTDTPASAAGWQKVLEIGRAKGYAFPNNYKNQVKWTVRPKILIPTIDTSGGLTGRKVARASWMDGATDLEVPHYGCKMLFQGNPQKDAAYHRFRLTATYYVKFRQRKP